MSEIVGSLRSEPTAGTGFVSFDGFVRAVARVDPDCTPGACKQLIPHLHMGEVAPPLPVLLRLMHEEEWTGQFFCSTIQHEHSVFRIHFLALNLSFCTAHFSLSQVMKISDLVKDLEKVPLNRFSCKPSPEASIKLSNQTLSFKYANHDNDRCGRCYIRPDSASKQGWTPITIPSLQAMSPWRSLSDTK